MNGYQRIQIPQNAAVRRQLDADRGHQREASGQYISGTLEAKMRVIQPMHVGTGDLVVPSTLNPPPHNPDEIPLIAPFFREANYVCIPGSSLKGAFRHLYETVTASCLAQADTGSRGQPVKVRLKSCSHRADSRDDVEREGVQLCPACQVFGAQGYMGQVNFHPIYHDVNRPTEIRFAPQRWSQPLQSEHSETRKVYTHSRAFAMDRNGNILIDRYPEPKEPLEVLPLGSVLTLKIDFTTLLSAELGLLLLLMGQKPAEKIYPKFGGVKAHGWGAVDIYDATIHLTDANSYLRYERTTPVHEGLESYFTSLENSDLIITTAWSQVKQHLADLVEENNA